MLYFSRWKTISIWAVVLLGVLFAAPTCIPQSLRSRSSRLVPETRDDAWPRSAGRLAHPAAARASGPRRRAAGGDARRHPHAAARRQDRLHRTFRQRIDRSGQDTRRRPTRGRKDSARVAAPARRLQHVRRGHDQRTVARRARTGRPALHADRRRHRLPHRSGGHAIDRGRRAARQRTRHDRTHHPAPGRRPHPRPGARPAGPAAPEGHPRPDRQADLPDGRPDRCRCRRRSKAGRRPARPSCTRPTIRLFPISSRTGSSCRARISSTRRLRSTSGPTSRSCRSASIRRARSGSARRRSRMSASCSRSSSTTR